MKKRVLVVFGTRPEAIKMSPLVKALKEESLFETKVCVTAQHRYMLDQVLSIFEIVPEYDLDVMRDGQDLYDITSTVLLGMKDVLEEFNPDIVLVHGDTTTTFTTSLAAFYKKIKVAHVEAGLRTYDFYAPFPEEANRTLTDVLSSLYFAPTEQNKQNLIKEGKNPQNIYVTGNTVIDALYMAVQKLNSNQKLKQKIKKELKEIDFSKRIILVTGHRRESFGEGFLNICHAIKEIAKNNKDVLFVYPVHLNPNVLKPVTKILSNIENIKLIKPLEYLSFVYIMNKSYLVLTDSGGVQEEAPSLGKPVLVMRKETERKEAIKAKTVKLVGVTKETITKEVQYLLDNTAEYKKMSKAKNPYGDGKASQKVVEILKSLKL